MNNKILYYQKVVVTIKFLYILIDQYHLIPKLKS